MSLGYSALLIPTYDTPRVLKTESPVNSSPVLCREETLSGVSRVSVPTLTLFPATLTKDRVRSGPVDLFVSERRRSPGSPRRRGPHGKDSVQVSVSESLRVNTVGSPLTSHNPQRGTGHWDPTRGVSVTGNGVRLPTSLSPEDQSHKVEPYRFVLVFVKNGVTNRTITETFFSFITKGALWTHVGTSWDPGPPTLGTRPSVCYSCRAVSGVRPSVKIRITRKGKVRTGRENSRVTCGVPESLPGP